MLEKVANTEKRCLLSANLWIFAWRLNNKHIQAYCDDLDTLVLVSRKFPISKIWRKFYFIFRKSFQLSRNVLYFLKFLVTLKNDFWKVLVGFNTKLNRWYYKVLGSHYIFTNFIRDKIVWSTKNLLHNGSNLAIPFSYNGSLNSRTIDT